MKKRYIVLILLSCLSMITYMDRLCISVAGPSMQKSLGINAEEWGWVLGAFALTYSLFEIPVGAWGDRFGQKKVLARIVIWWSALTSITGLVQGFRTLVVVRALFGMGEAGAYPNMSGVVVHWFPIKERSRAMGVVWAASRVGGVLSPLIIVPLITFTGWREAFWIFGLFGIIWMVIWRKTFYNRPNAQPGITTEELKQINTSGSAIIPETFPWKKIFSSSQVWLIMLMYWCYVWGSWFYLSWFHTYLINGRGFSMTEMAVYSPLPFIMGIIGNIAGGHLADKCSIKFGLKKGRRLVGSVSLALSACCLLITALTHGKVSGIIFLTLGFGFMDCMTPSAWANCIDIGESHAGAVSGAMNSAGNLGGFVCSIVFGLLVQRSGGYSLAVITVASFVMIGAILFTCINPERKIKTEPAIDLSPIII